MSTYRRHSLCFCIYNNLSLYKEFMSKPIKLNRNRNNESRSNFNQKTKKNRQFNFSISFVFLELSFKLNERVMFVLYPRIRINAYYNEKKEESFCWLEWVYHNSKIGLTPIRKLYHRVRMKETYYRIEVE